jgi:hypothetical protein
MFSGNFCQNGYVKGVEFLQLTEITIRAFAVKHFTWHISRIDPITSEITPGMHKEAIHILIRDLPEFNS